MMATHRLQKAWSARQTDEARAETLAMHREVATAIAEQDGTRARIGMDRHFDRSIDDIFAT